MVRVALTPTTVAAVPHGNGRGPVVIHLVDDDDGFRDSLRSLLQRFEAPIHCHATAEEFLAAYEADRPSCLLLDLNLPGIGGLPLLERLVAGGQLLPTLVLSADAAVERVVTAIQRGAVGFLQKPPDPRQLLDQVAQMLAAAPGAAADRRTLRQVAVALRSLTPRESEVYSMLAAGTSTKQIALSLNLSVRTAHIHRTNVFRKLGVENIVALARLAERARSIGLIPGG